MFDKINPFRKKEVISAIPETESTDANSTSDSEKKQNETKPKLTVEEELALIESKKKEIAELISQRHDYYAVIKGLEEKIILSGASKDKVKEIRAKILEDSQEIAQQIKAIRKEYSIEITPVELWSGRLAMLNNEIARIEGNMAPEYRQLRGSFNSYFGDTPDFARLNRLTSDDATAVVNFKEYILQKSDLPEAQSFFEKIRALSPYNQEELELIKKELKSFKELLDAKIKEKTLYKTPGEEKEAYLKIDKLIKLSNSVVKELRDAENKEGRYGDKKGYF